MWPNYFTKTIPLLLFLLPLHIHPAMIDMRRMVPLALCYMDSDKFKGHSKFSGMQIVHDRS